MIESQIEIIRRTLVILDDTSCSFFARKTRPTTKLAPVTEIDESTGIRTELNFTHTRHRYPWICSLRTRGVNHEHLCAVTLLAVPPQPYVIVGAAHCT